jgi:hypothetical protein
MNLNNKTTQNSLVTWRCTTYLNNNKTTTKEQQQNNTTIALRTDKTIVGSRRVFVSNNRQAGRSKG